MSSASPRSAGLGVPPRKDRRAGALVRYVFAATLVRSADGGAVVAIVLLAHACGMPGWLAGLLGASITAPHLFGPFIARRLDTARDGRKVIASSAVLHGVLLGAAALLLPIAWPVWPAMLLFASGIFGPMLTGGISSRLPSIAGPEQRSQRRAQSWDVASYGLSGTLGPAAVAWIAAAADALTATLVLARAAIVGAGAVLALPKQEPLDKAVDVPSPGRTLRLIWKRGPLRRTLGLTVTVAFSVAVLPIYAVATAPALGGAAAAGTLVAAYGIGNLLGSATLMVRPLRSDADPLMSSLAALVAATLILVMLTPTFPTSLIAFCLAGIANAMFFAATLAARSEYAPIEARGQIFIWVGALKIAAGSAGASAPDARQKTLAKPRHIVSAAIRAGAGRLGSRGIRAGSRLKIIERTAVASGPRPVRSASACPPMERTSAMEPTYVMAESAPAPVGPYSHACGLPNGLLFLSGQTPIDPETGQLVSGGIEEQTARVFDNLGLVLEAAGSSWRDVVKVNVFLVDMDDFAAMNAVYARYFDGQYPARTTVAVAGLPLRARVEIELQAMRRVG